MYIRQCFRTVEGERRAYWALVESVRTARGPRQNVVAWLGALDQAGRLGVLQAARGIDNDPASNVDSSKFFQQSLFEFEDTSVVYYRHDSRHSEAAQSFERALRFRAMVSKNRFT